MELTTDWTRSPSCPLFTLLSCDLNGDRTRSCNGSGELHGDLYGEPACRFDCLLLGCVFSSFSPSNNSRFGRPDLVCDLGDAIGDEMSSWVFRRGLRGVNGILY
eukprot:8223448-Pyramimonas_sp.AAC.2